MRYVVTLALMLVATWLLLSGYLYPMLLGLGALSVLLVVLLLARMNMLDDETVSILFFGPRLVPYLLWLTGQMLLANLDVIWRIWRPAGALQPEVVRMMPRSQSAIARTLFANSVTLTPGTVSMELYDSELIVHALHKGSADGVRDGVMDARVAALEGA